MQIHVVCHHLSSIIILVTVTSEMTKPVQPAVPPEIGRDKQPNERNNEIVIELDGENQYRRTQPRANEPQGNPVCAILKLPLHADNSILPDVEKKKNQKCSLSVSLIRNPRF